MSRLDRYTESLVEEGLKDAAETFFGARKGLEDEIALFETRVASLQEVGDRVSRRCATMVGLLPDPKGCDLLWEVLGILGMDSQMVESCCRSEPLPLGAALGVTRAARYARTVFKAFTLWCAAVHEYREGVYHDDPDVPGKKVKAVHYTGLVTWGEELNQKIVRVNRYHSPSEAMQFAKKMDVAAQGMENVAGAPLQYSLDQEMAFKPVDVTAAGLINWPKLPLPSEVRKRVLCFAKEQYKRNPQKAWENFRRMTEKK